MQMQRSNPESADQSRNKPSYIRRFPYLKKLHNPIQKHHGRQHHADLHRKLLKAKNDNGRDSRKQDSRAPRTDRKLEAIIEKASLRHLMTAQLRAPLHPFDPSFLIHDYALNLFPHWLHTQYALLFTCLPFPHAPHRIPIGPNRIAPQQPFPAEKSLPVVVVSVII